MTSAAREAGKKKRLEASTLVVTRNEPANDKYGDADNDGDDDDDMDTEEELGDGCIWY